MLDPAGAGAGGGVSGSQSSQSVQTLVQQAVDAALDKAQRQWLSALAPVLISMRGKEGGDSSGGSDYGGNTHTQPSYQYTFKHFQYTSTHTLVFYSLTHTNTFLHTHFLSYQLSHLPPPPSSPLSLSLTRCGCGVGDD